MVTGSASGGTGSRPRRACFTASNRPGTIRTCARSPATSASAVLHAYPGGDRQRRATDQLSPLPPRSLAVHAHNGYLNELATVKRDLVFAVDPSLYPEIKGQADTELLFYLALTLGLEDDPPAAVAQAIGFVEHVAERHGVTHPFQGTIATTDGESIWAFRYFGERSISPWRVGDALARCIRSEPLQALQIRGRGSRLRRGGARGLPRRSPRGSCARRVGRLLLGWGMKKAPLAGLFQCAREDSNLHGPISPQGPQPCASTNSATGAWAASISRRSGRSLSPSVGRARFPNTCSIQATAAIPIKEFSHGPDQATAGNRRLHQALLG